MSFDLIDRKFGRKPEPEPEEECPLCFDTGWESYGLGHGDPHHRECEKCFNPRGYPSP